MFMRDDRHERGSGKRMMSDRHRRALFTDPIVLQREAVGLDTTDAVLSLSILRFVWFTTKGFR